MATPRPDALVPDGAAIAAERAELLARPDLRGAALATELSRLADSWFARLGHDLPRSWALMATGGYGRGGLCPGSDIDVVLLHPRRAKPSEVKSTAERIWYPLWDAGAKLSPAAHTTKSVLGLAGDDLVTATSLLEVRCVAGDAAAVATVGRDAVQSWRTRPLRWVARLRDATEERWARFGEVSSLLEPDLKDGRGGLRDHDVLAWSLVTGLTGVVSELDGAAARVAQPLDALLAVRVELHRLTGRATNVVLLQDQDALAERMAFADADALMRSVSSAARTIDWTVARFWHRLDRGVSGLDRVRRVHQLPESIVGASLNEDEVDVTPEADFADQSLVFSVAAAAARLGVPLSRGALDTMATRVPPTIGQWTERTRRAFVGLLGCGPSTVTTVEALEHAGLFSRFLPEWAHVRSLPQRNAFHIYNVDRHLLVTVANAAPLLRTVTRPDLLLVGALLHDIGKGSPGDHTEAGMKLVAEIVPRMGFPPEDVATVSSMVEHHLLLAETATRRDLSDPRTAANVAASVRDVTTLSLLRALTEADSLATGPSAWSDWKRSLIDALTAAVEAELHGQPAPLDAVDVEHRFAFMLEQIRLGGGGVWAEHEQRGESERFTVAAADRPGLFAQVAGTLALHRVDVVGAEAWTSDDGIAVEQFDIVPSWSDPPSFERIQRDLIDVLAGRLDIANRLEQRVANAQSAFRRAIAAAPARTEVIVSNDASDSTTMIDVRVPDAPAVLYRLSAALSGAGLNIRSAKVATLGHEIVDVFYVQRRVKGGTTRQLAPGEIDEIRRLVLDATAPR